MEISRPPSVLIKPGMNGAAFWRAAQCLPPTLDAIDRKNGEYVMSVTFVAKKPRQLKRLDKWASCKLFPKLPTNWVAAESYDPNRTERVLFLKLTEEQKSELHQRIKHALDQTSKAKPRLSKLVRRAA